MKKWSETKKNYSTQEKMLQSCIFHPIANEPDASYEKELLDADTSTTKMQKELLY